VNVHENKLLHMPDKNELLSMITSVYMHKSQHHFSGVFPCWE